MMQKFVIVLCFSLSFAQNGFTRAHPQGFQFGDGFSFFVPRATNGNQANQVITTSRPQQASWLQNFGNNQDSRGSQGNRQNFGWIPFGTNQNARNPSSENQNFGNINNFDSNRETQYFRDNKGSENNQNLNNPSVSNNFGEQKEISGPQQIDRRQPQTNNFVEITPNPTENRRQWNFQPDDSCRAVDQTIGSCVNIKSCAKYLTLLSQVRSDPRVADVLRRSQCGFEGSDPKVCCPKSKPIPTAPPQTVPPVTEIPVTAPPATRKPATESPATNTPFPDVPKSEIRESDDLSQFVDSLPEPPVCGFSNETFSRVVGGEDAKLGAFPWMALLGYHSKFSEPRWLCGGSLVTNKHVLTAAHCINGRESTLYLVRLGELDLSRDDDGATPIDIPIKTKIKHEDYSPKSFTNDIGLLVLERSVEYTGLIKPICLPKPQRLRALTFERYSPMVAGWGDVEFHGPSASHLQVLQLPVVSNEFCRNAYRKYKAQVIDERVLCAGFERGEKDACQGDSGGPLMQPDYDRSQRRSYFYQIGVVSFGRKCAEAGYPGVYTRTTHFMPWLHKNIVGSNLI